MDIYLLREYSIFANEQLLSLEILENQGFNNTNYLLKSSKNDYLVRVFGQNIQNRALEFKIAKLAYTKGIGQKPLLLEKDFMVLDFTKGQHFSCLTRAQLQNLGKTLRKLHNIRHYQKPYDMAKDYKTYSNKPLGNRAYRANLLFKELGKSKKDYVLCHHDLNPKNILFNKNSIQFIDWEYIRVNDRYFDLASIVVEFKLGKRDLLTFLQAYFTCKEKYNPKKLNLYIKTYKILYQLWVHKHFTI
jgi:thiamine kinase-like enzyme